MNKIKSKTIILSVLIVIMILCAVSCSTKEPKTVIKNIAIPTSNGQYIKAQLVIPDNYNKSQLPLITLGHGYGGDMDSAGGEDLATALANSGFATIRMDYRHYQDQNLKTSENQYTIDTMIDDQLKCIRYMINNYNIDINNIGLYGRSLGGRVAMKMANESSGGYKYKAMALIAPAGNDTALIHYMHGKDKWNMMKKEAMKEGFVTHQKVKLTPDFFTSVDDYVPSLHGESYNGNVLVIYNTLDYVVLPECSKECAKAYKNSSEIEVTTKNYHGYEMGYKKSKLKDMLTDKICSFFNENLK